jgi:hypothetical protein
LLKAASGTTLSPREARTLRRTAKDLVTAVPVVVILLVPLTPVREKRREARCRGNGARLRASGKTRKL